MGQQAIHLCRAPGQCAWPSRSTTGSAAKSLLEIARRLDELAALAAARAQRAEREAAARRAAQAALLAEAAERLRSFDPLSSRPDPRSLEALHELALRERMGESRGTASDASWDWPSLGDYWHYLIHPSEMDADLQTAQKVALGTSALALGGAGALTAAGLGTVTVSAAGAAAAPIVLTELADTAVEERVSQLAGVPVIIPVSPIDAVQDLGKLGVKQLAKEGAEQLTESVASKAVRAGDAAGGATSSHVADLVAGAKAQYPKLAGRIQDHHIAPKYLGGAADGATLALDSAYHQLITNEFRRLHPYGLPKPSPERLQEIMRQVYSKYPLPNTP